jgi:hypothetical protein
VDANKVKNLKAFVQRRLEEKKQAKHLTPPYPAPRYDEVFEKGQEWLDTMAATGSDLLRSPFKPL